MPSNNKLFDVWPGRLCGVAFFCAAACSTSDGMGGGSSPGTSYDFTPTLEQTTSQVIVPTYEELMNRASDLRVAASTLAESTTAESLEAAKNAWISARVAWERSEGFLFGPVSDLGLDPSLDSWPVDRTQLDQVLRSGLELSAESIASNFGGGLRGFHTIEYLLWGESGKTATDLAAAPRELKYLIAATAALEEDATTLHEAWIGDDGYGQKLVDAGKSSGVFLRQTHAIQQLLNGMIGICDEVANGKIADPYKADDRALEESRFSDNSTRDFSDNIRSVKILYEGSRDGVADHSIATFVQAQNQELDKRLRSEIDTAIGAIEAISADGETFGSAISNPHKREAIESAQESIRTVMRSLQGDVLSLVAD